MGMARVEVPTLRFLEDQATGQMVLAGGTAGLESRVARHDVTWRVARRMCWEGTPPSAVEHARWGQCVRVC